jgi:hypothetical protein
MPEDTPSTSVRTLLDVLRRSEPRPPSDAKDVDKRTYATRFADNMARCVANGLRDRFPGILPDEEGHGTESPARSVRGPKKLDVNYSTVQLDLGFGISLKSVHFRDASPPRRYTHNMKRNDEELRVEASGYHQRQPFAVMVGVVFLPVDACDDGRGKNPSSFGAWVKYLRPLAGRDEPHEEIARFERVFIGLYDPAGSKMEFFDVDKAPPRSGRPRDLLSYLEVLDEIEKAYLRRNVAEFEWADEETSENGNSGGLL